MDIKSLGKFENLVSPEGAAGIGKTGGIGKGTSVGSTPGTEQGGKSFADTLGSIQNQFQNPQVGQIAKAQATDAAAGVKFSNHAVERMMSRGINYGPQDIQRLNEAVAKAAAKGSKDSLILMNDSALIVSVKNKTVVTVMDKAALKENVFTNIDSTIVM